jgi:hypothetical protein
MQNHTAPIRRLPAMRLLLAVFALLCSAAAVHAETASAAFQVSVNLAHYVKLNVVSQPRSIEVSEADIARGYVDVPMPVQVSVQSSSPHGVTILFARVGDHVRGARVQGLGREVRLDSEAEMNWKPAAQGELAQFHFRLQLAPELGAGRYPWPIQVSMSAN